MDGNDSIWVGGDGLLIKGDLRQKAETLSRQRRMLPASGNAKTSIELSIGLQLTSTKEHHSHVYSTFKPPCAFDLPHGLRYSGNAYLGLCALSRERGIH
jgi:hypothetical protein